MDSKNMNIQYGTKWFTFYTKVRPWLSCLSGLAVLFGFAYNTELYLGNVWLFLYSVLAIATPILAIIVFVKSNGDYVEFVGFVKGVLLFETISMAYQQGVEQYMSDVGVGVAFGVFVGDLIILYFLWYRLNVKYFVKRIRTGEEKARLNPNWMAQGVSYSYRNITDPIRFCRKCGEKLEENGNFCSKCGLKVLK